MIIEVKKLIAQGKYSGSFDFEYGADNKLIDIPYVEFAGSIRIKGEFFVLEDDSVEVVAKISFALKGQCSRCLEPAEDSVVGDFHEYFVTEENGEDYIYRNGLLDLTEAVNESIQFNMPSKLLCNENCLGIEYHS